MVNIKCFANSKMKKIICKFSIVKKSRVKTQIIDYRIKGLVINAKVCCDDNREWLSPQSENMDYPNIVSQYQNLTAYEWDSFELFFNKKVIKHQYKQNIYAVIECFEYWKKTLFPQIPICLIIMVQKGFFRNITVKMHVKREGEFYLDENIESYKQPVLYAFFDS